MELALRVFRHQEYQEVIKAGDVRSDELGDLVCRCVECGEFVDWVNSNSVTALKSRPAHFRHGKGVNRQMAMVCEKRVQRYSLAKIAQIERSQSEFRSRYIRREFWKLMTYYYEEVLDFPIGNILKTAPSRLRELAEHLATQFRDEKNDFNPSILQIIDTVFDGEVVFIRHPYEGMENVVAPSRAIQVHFSSYVVGNLNRKLHELICQDVLKLLRERKSWELCVNLFTLAVHCIFDCLKDGNCIGLIGEDGAQLHRYRVNQEGQMDIGIDPNFLNNVHNQYIFYSYAVGHVLIWIALTPYNQTLEKLNKEQYASRTS